MNRIFVLDERRTAHGATPRRLAAPAVRTRHSTEFMAGIVAAVDALLALLAGLSAALVAGAGGDEGDAGRAAAATIVGTCIFLAATFLAGQYRAEGLDRRVRRLARPLGLWSVAVMLTVTVAFLWDGGIELSRGWLVAWFAIGAAGLLGWRGAAALQMRRWRSAGLLAERIAVIGAADQARRLIEHLGRPGAEGDAVVVGTYAVNDSQANAGMGADGVIEDLLREAPGMDLDAILVALPWSQSDLVADVCMRLRDLPVDVRLAPDLAAYDLPRCAPRAFGGHFALEVWGRPLRDWRGFIKRVEDLVLAGGLIVLFAPVMALCALAIRLTSPGPVLLRQRRYGFANEPIEVFKFRSMYHDQCDASGARATVRGDLRVTPVGRFLRRTSLDELPQLYNVVLGTMSLVGPRAHPVEMLVGERRYDDVVRHYAARHRMKPGITGLAQINGYRGLVDTLEKAQRRLDYDLHYVEHWSLGMDLRILFVTIFRGFTHESAF